MKRILQIVPTLGYGGVAKFLLNYYSVINKEHYKFDFVTHGLVEDFHAELISEGSEIFYVKPMHKVGIIKYFAQFYSILRKGKYDIVHIHLGHLTGIMAMFCKLFSSSKIVCHAHTTKCMKKSHERLMPLFRFLARYFSDDLFACGYEAGRFCFGDVDFKIIPNAINPSVFKKASYKEIDNLKRELNIVGSTRIVGHIGAFVAPKNHDYICSIIKEMYNCNFDFCFVFVGDGPLRKNVEDTLAKERLMDNVRFVGVQSNIPLYMSLFDVMILPSISEGWPVVLAEAQFMGLKTIISDTIDKSVDLRLGLISRIGTKNDDISTWVDEIKKKYTRPNEQDINKVFTEKCFEINSAAKKLIYYYDCL